MTLVNELLAARTLIAERGLAKNTFNRLADGSMCTVGAVARAVGHSFETEPFPWLSDDMKPAIRALSDTLREASPLPLALDDDSSRRQAIYVFNDAEETTQDDVLGLFDTTIARVSAEELVSA